MKKILAVYDSDFFYATHFLEYFKSKKEFMFEILAFTKPESLEDYLRHHKMEILIAGSPVPPESIAGDHAGLIIYLRESRHQESSDPQPSVFRYQPAGQVMEEVLKLYREGLAAVTESREGRTMDILTLYSPISSTIKHQFAWCLSLRLAMQKKALFILLELFSAQVLIFQKSSGQALSEFIYYLKENQNSIMKLKPLLTYSNNLDCLSGSAHAFDLLSLNKEDVQRWISDLRQHTDYQEVIFFLGFYSEAGAELMRLSDEVMIMTEEAFYEKAVLTDWESQMERIGIEVKPDKFQKIILSPELKIKEEYRTLPELMRSTIWEEAAKYVNR